MWSGSKVEEPGRKKGEENPPGEKKEEEKIGGSLTLMAKKRHAQ